MQKVLSIKIEDLKEPVNFFNKKLELIDLISSITKQNKL